MEAMAAGKVVILPNSYELVFGNAAVYSTPEGVESLVQVLWKDKAKYEAQAKLGFDFVVKNCSREVITTKLKNLLG